MKSARVNSIGQLAWAGAGFVLTIALLDAQALATWAERLEVGPGREQAVAAATALHTWVAPLGVDAVRRQGMAALALLGWSDDPAGLAEARARIVGPARTCATSELASKAAPRLPFHAPVAAGVPRLTPLTPLAAVAGGKPRVVALVGDSMMAVGLSDVLLQDAAGNPNLRVVKAFKSGTGLARPDVFDWTREYPAMIGDQEPDVILVAIGANDGQGFVEDGKVLAFGSEAWVKAYEQRTAAFLDLLTAHGARVVWVGLPPMKAEKFDEKTAVVNRIAYSVVSRNALASWWNPAALIGDEAGRFREFAELAGGKTVRIRQADGIHLSDEGAGLLAPPLMGWLNAPAPAVAAAPAAQPKARLPKAARRKGERG
jgi:hypothetical protein